MIAGQVFVSEARRNGALILPVDSEHNAIFQSLNTDFGSCMAVSNNLRNSAEAILKGNGRRTDRVDRGAGNTVDHLAVGVVRFDSQIAWLTDGNSIERDA